MLSSERPANVNNNDRLYNNSFFAVVHRRLFRTLTTTSSNFPNAQPPFSAAVRGVTNYDSNNAPANTFYSAWDSWVEGEMRQPLLQGGGLEFNRIAGPGSTPGVYNGVLIAKVNSDISDADFQDLTARLHQQRRKCLLGPVPRFPRI